MKSFSLSRNVSRNALALLLAATPLALFVACSATNGDPIPNEARNAGEIDAGGGSSGGNNGGGDGSSSSADGGDANSQPGKDSGKDSTTTNDAKPPPPVVVINEIYVDHDFIGDGAEFVELRTDPGAVVDDLKLRLIDHNGQVKYTVDVAPAGAKATTGLWVVSGGQTYKVALQSRDDQVVSLNSWGLDNARGAVQLLRGTELLDVVGWSDEPDASSLPPPAPPPLATGEGAPALVPTIPRPAGAGKTAHSFGRSAAAADTNNNLADFCSMGSSPGYAQKACD